MSSSKCTTLLALHHWHLHKDNVAEDMEGNQGLLQAKDICVFTRWTHWTSVVLLLVISYSLLLAVSFKLD